MLLFNFLHKYKIQFQHPGLNRKPFTRKRVLDWKNLDLVPCVRIIIAQWTAKIATSQKRLLSKFYLVTSAGLIPSSKFSIRSPQNVANLSTEKLSILFLASGSWKSKGFKGSLQIILFRYSNLYFSVTPGLISPLQISTGSFTQVEEVLEKSFNRIPASKFC